MGKNKKLKNIFTKVYLANLWGDETSVSGPGSSMEQTTEIRIQILQLIRKYKINTIIDAPCGDFNWMQELVKSIEDEIDQYLGVDIVEELVNENNKKYQTSKINFKQIDITRNVVPIADLIICRDCFLHLSYRNIFKILKNFRKSGAKFILASSYIEHKNSNVLNYSIGGRALNLASFPFNVKNPTEIINENYINY